ncbi:MAG: universal stress protein [Maricaulaceae bacterium]
MAREIIAAGLSGAPEDAQTLAAAKLLAGVLDARVRAALMLPEPEAILPWGGLDAAPAVAALQAIREGNDAARERARTGFAAAQLGATAEFSEFVGLQADAVAARRGAGFMVLDAASASGQGKLRDAFSAALLNESLAVFIPRGPMGDARTLAVAWDGSRESVRALRAAGPLFRPGAKVGVLHCSEALDASARPCAAPEPAAEWIAARGAAVEIIEVEAGRDLGASLLQAAEGFDAEVMVAGAFGQSRLREFVFGGVTRSLLNADAPSLLIAH